MQRGGPEDALAHKLSVSNILTKLKKNSPIPKDVLSSEYMKRVRPISGLPRGTHPSKIRAELASEYILPPGSMHPVKGTGIDRGMLRQILGLTGK